jgi:predicted dehydrogenase
LLNQSIHIIDLLQWIMGPAVEVMAWTARLAHERIEVEDTAVAAIRFDSGAVGTVLGTTAAYPGLTTRLSIYGDRGSAVIDNDRLTYFHAAGREKKADAPGAGGGDNQASAVGANVAAVGANVAAVGTDAAAAPVGAGADPADLSMAHREQLRDFCDAVEHDRPPLIDGHAGRRTAALVFALYESASTGRPVQLA